MSLGIFFKFVEEFSSLDLAYCRKIFKLLSHGSDASTSGLGAEADDTYRL